MLCFEDVAVALRRAESRGEPATFVVDRDYALAGKTLLVQGERVTTSEIPSLLGWVAVGLCLRHA